MAIIRYELTDGSPRLKATTRDVRGRQIAERGFADSDAGRKAAQAWIDEQQAQRTRRVPAPVGKGVPKFGTFVQDALEAHAVRESTRTRYVGNATTHLVPVLGTLRLNKITATHCQDAIDNAVHYATGEPLAATTKHQLAAALMVIMGAAKNEYALPENPALGLTLPQALRRERVRHFEADEAQAILEAAPNRRTRLVYTIGFGIGPRMGELLAVGADRRDIDLRRRKYHIDRQVVGDGYGEARVTRELKTEESRRSLPLGQRTIEAFEELIDMTPTGPFCLAPRGKYRGQLQSRRSAYSVWWNTLDRAGIERCGMHALRHTYASVLLADPNVSIYVVSRRLGHATVEETTRTYGHLMADSDALVADALDDWLSAG